MGTPQHHRGWAAFWTAGRPHVFCDLTPQHRHRAGSGRGQRAGRSREARKVTLSGGRGDSEGESFRTVRVEDEHWCVVWENVSNPAPHRGGVASDSSRNPRGAPGRGALSAVPTAPPRAGGAVTAAAGRNCRWRQGAISPQHSDGGNPTPLSEWRGHPDSKAQPPQISLQDGDLGPKASPNAFRRLEITSSIFLLTTVA